MPAVSTFFGIVIRMFYVDHPPPHFQAESQRQHAKFSFEGDMMVGSIRSRTALRLIIDWAQLHRAELEANWERAEERVPLERIAPLE